MGIKKNILKEVQDIKKNLQVFTNESQTKIKKYEEIVEYLKDVKINVSSIKPIINDKGTVNVEITYSIPKQIIEFDDENNIVANKIFKAINMLNLISFEDMEKIGLMLEKTKMQNRR